MIPMLDDLTGILTMLEHLTTSQKTKVNSVDISERNKKIGISMMGIGVFEDKIRELLRKMSLHSFPSTIKLAMSKNAEDNSIDYWMHIKFVITELNTALDDTLFEHIKDMNADYIIMVMPETKNINYKRILRILKNYPKKIGFLMLKNSLNDFDDLAEKIKCLLQFLGYYILFSAPERYRITEFLGIERLGILKFYEIKDVEPLEALELTIKESLAEKSDASGILDSVVLSIALNLSNSISYSEKKIRSIIFRILSNFKCDKMSWFVHFTNNPNGLTKAILFRFYR